MEWHVYYFWKDAPGGLGSVCFTVTADDDAAAIEAVFQQNPEFRPPTGARVIVVPAKRFSKLV